MRDTYEIYYKNTETGDFGEYGIITTSEEGAIRRAKKLKEKMPWCDFSVVRDMDETVFSTAEGLHEETEFAASSTDTIDPAKAGTEGGKLRAALMASMAKDYGCIGQANAGNEHDDLRTPKCEFDVNALYATAIGNAKKPRTFVEAEEIIKQKLTDLGYNPEEYPGIRVVSKPSRKDRGPLVKVTIKDTLNKRKLEDLDEVNACNEAITEYPNGLEFSFSDPVSTLEVYLEWEGIIGYDWQIIEAYEEGGYDGLSDYLDEEGIYGYTEHIRDILEGKPAYCSQMEMEDLESICRHSYISIEDAKIHESLNEAKTNAVYVELKDDGRYISKEIYDYNDPDFLFTDNFDDRAFFDRYTWKSDVQELLDEFAIGYELDDFKVHDHFEESIKEELIPDDQLLDRLNAELKKLRYDQPAEFTLGNNLKVEYKVTEEGLEMVDIDLLSKEVISRKATVVDNDHFKWLKSKLRQDVKYGFGSVESNVYGNLDLGEGYNRLKRKFDTIESAKKFANFLDPDLDPRIEQCDTEDDNGNIVNWYEVTYWDEEDLDEKIMKQGQAERFKHMNESRGGWNQYVYSVGADPSDRELLQQDIEALRHFGLTYLGTTQEPNDPTSGEMFFKGPKHAIADYLDSWVGGIQIVPEYLIPEEDFEDTVSFDYLQDHAIDEGVKIVPDHVTSMQMLNHDLGESVEDTPVIWAVDIVAWEDDELEKSHVVETVEVTWDELNDRYHGKLGNYLKIKQDADRLALNSDIGQAIRSIASKKMESDWRSFDMGYGVQNLRVVKNELPSGVTELGKVLGRKLGLRREALSDEEVMNFEGEDQEMSCTLPVAADDEDGLDDLNETYKVGGERTFTPEEPEYAKIKAVADKLNSMDLVSKWDHRTPYTFEVEDVYLDYGTRWMWTTIVAHLQGGGDSHQILSPREWLDIVNDAAPVDVLVDEMLADEYAQFEKSQKEQECLETKKAPVLKEAYELVYHFGKDGDDEYFFSRNYGDVLKALKQAFSEEELVDMVEESSFDPEKDDFDDFLLSNIDTFEDFLHDHFEGEAEKQYELDKDYQREFDPRSWYGEGLTEAEAKRVRGRRYGNLKGYHKDLEKRKVREFLNALHFRDEVEEERIGDWEINAWNSPSGYYIVQLDNDRLNRHLHLGDIESQEELEYMVGKLSDRQLENLVEKVSPEGYAPKQTGTAYKVFRVKNGKLYPPMVANAGGADTPIGVWLDAEEGEFAGVSKTGRPQVKSTGSGTLAYRPGWHLGDVPRAPQFDRRNKETGEMEFPADFVWAECDYAMDVDYQGEADERGYMRTKVDSEGNVVTTRSDKYQHSLAGLPKLPKDGYYKYRTNPRPDTVPWVITGQMRVNRLLSDAEVNEILKSKGIAPIHRQGGDKTLAELGLKESLSIKEDAKFKKVWMLGGDQKHPELDDYIEKYVSEKGTEIDCGHGFNSWSTRWYQVGDKNFETLADAKAYVAQLEGESLGEAADFVSRQDYQAAQKTLKWSTNPKEVAAAQKVIKKYKEWQSELEAQKKDTVEEDLGEIIQDIHDQDEYLWNLHDTDYTWLYDEVEDYLEDGEDLDAPGQFDLIAKAVRRMPQDKQMSIYQRLIAPLQGERYPLDPNELMEAFEDEYNDCYVEFRDGKPFMAYTSLKYAKDGVFWDRFADAQNGEGYDHKYEIKYLKDGEYSLPESLQEDILDPFYDDELRRDTLPVPEDEKKESLKEGKTDIIKNLEDSGFEIYHKDELEPELDEEIIDYMAEEGLDILLSHPSMARFWYFRDLDSMVKYFENGGQVSVDQHAQVLGE